MGAVSRSLEIDAALEARLEAEAQLAQTSVAEVAKTAIEVYLGAREAKRIAIRRALEDGEQRGYVDEAHVREWVATWDSDRESPPPKASKTLASRR